jgi:hypothetical protein
MQYRMGDVLRVPSRAFDDRLLVVVSDNDDGSEVVDVITQPWDEVDTTRSFGAEMQAARQSLGLSDEDVARRADVPLRMYRSWESMDRGPSPKSVDSWHMLARVYAVLHGPGDTDGAPGRCPGSDGR